MHKPIIAITLGDPGGIGGEVSVKALLNADVYTKCRPFIICDRSALELREYSEYSKSCEYNVVGDISKMKFTHGTIDVLEMNVLKAPPRLGEITAEHGEAAFRYIDEAIRLALLKQVDAVVTAPISKEALKLAGHNFPGHTEIFAARTNTQDYAMMLAHENFRVIHVSTHTSLRNACDLVTKDRVFEVIRVAHETCRNLGISEPKVAVAGLNPHAGENGMFGTEEIDAIIPAIEAAKASGITALGPFPPDTIFSKLAAGHYDICVCMYHDQGHIPTKLLGFDFAAEHVEISGINMTVGLPIIRVSVDHGTAFDIAGKNLASAGSLLSAIDYATAFAVKRFYSKSGAINEIGNIDKDRKPSCVCLVTDDFVAKNARVYDAIDRMSKENEWVTVKVNGEPTFGMLRDALGMKALAKIDMVAAIGGGSVIDVAKLIAAAAGNPEYAKNPTDATLIKQKGAYLVCVPTTAGTGAEATPNSIMYDEQTQSKIGIVNKLTIADAVLLDSDLTATMPEQLTLATGLDALSHAVESLFSKKANAYSDFYAKEAIRLIVDNLEQVLDDGSSVEARSLARTKMLEASHYAGICLTSSSTCAIHAMAYPMSRYKVSHGAGIALLFAPVMQVFSQKCANFNTLLGEGFLPWLEKVTKRLDLSAAAYGITTNDYPQFAKEAHAIRRLMDNNPFDMSEAEMVEIYERMV